LPREVCAIGTSVASLKFALKALLDPIPRMGGSTLSCSRNCAEERRVRPAGIVAATALTLHA